MNDVSALPTIQYKPKQKRQFRTVPASNFSIKALTDIYNETRVDYVVPMPMSVAKLKEYIINYDINLDLSTVVLSEYHQPLGLGMLGMRDDQTWITRLGVTPRVRQGGIGRAIMTMLIENARRSGANVVMLEVIKNNIPAQRLFESLGFIPLRDLHIIRRPPATLNMAIGTSLYIDVLGYQEALEILAFRSDNPTWVTANKSLRNAGNLSGLLADIPGQGRGWLVYQNTVFQLGRLTLETDSEDPFAMATTLLQHLHWRHPVQDTIIENIPVNDKHWPAFEALDYLVSFSRVEMKLDLT